MGNTFEVWTWEKDEQGNYAFQLAYAGEDYHEAVQALHAAKDTGVGYIKFEWRPRRP